MRRMHQYSPFLSPSGQPMPHYTFPYVNANRPMSGPAVPEEILPFPPGSPGEGPHIPQIDGPPDDSQESMKYTSHPPRPEPLISPSEAITSDLDDLETDEEDAEDGVSRKKTKWKCVLNNGVIHSSG
ncbi:hypothetical protein B0H14DRAFT_2762126 [Mycena olivaceomarginata]|nr:hypothetical protein B0H14DRAFT_2762126 [Mycena olivaceomarginata]